MAEPRGEPQEVLEDTSTSPTAIDHWHVITALLPVAGMQRYVVGSDVISPALLALYEAGADPDVKIFETLQRQPQDHVEQIHAVGRWQQRFYCVSERIEGGTLGDFLSGEQPDLETATLVLREVGGALASFSTIGLRHRALRPDNILVRTTTPLDLVITGFGSARLSDLDLDVVAPLQVSRYSAPEAILGAVSASSDWWSLGVILLEYLTAGRCFADISDQAFMLSTVTRGIPLPRDLDPRLELVLRGLLARDPLKRWQWKQLSCWLAGETVEAPGADCDYTQRQSTQPLAIGGRDYYRADAFALAAAEPGNWEAGRQLFRGGTVTTWAEAAQVDPTMLAALRRVGGIEGISDDHRHALALMALNRDLPLTLRGQIVTPSWLLANAIEAYEVVTGAVIGHLRQYERERWLVQVADRVQRIRERAASLEITLDDEQFRVTCLATSRPRLETLWEARRALAPDSDHAGLASLLDRITLSDEDLILLLSASPHQFEPADAILARAADLAAHHELHHFNQAGVAPWLARTRRELYAELEKRLVAFARSGIAVIDEWADTLRIQRRLSLPRALVMLSIPATEWREPPRQQYVENILDFFEKRAASVAQRGPLVRLIIGKTTARVDLHELGGPRTPAGAMIDRIVSRDGQSIRLDPGVLTAQPSVTERLRRLQNHAAMYRRDTGVDGLYLAFPFLIMRTTTSARPRIMPVLLWPVRVNLEVGSRSDGTISFDLERTEVRVNPAIPALVGLEETQRWREILEDILQRNVLDAVQVMDALGSLVPPRERELVRLPNKDYSPPHGRRQLVFSAVLFHAEFMGQAIAEDLRALRRKSLEGTALEAAIRSQAQAAATAAPAVSNPPETDRYPVIDSDPSQDEAVMRARISPGLLTEGPPGTGKSQTIVNIVSDCIGRGESVLIVCQKQAAIQVVAKRLEAEGIGERGFVIADLGSDRQHVIVKLREQLDRIRNGATTSLDALRAQRRTTAERIQSIEGDVDAHHAACHHVDAAIGMSYRALLSELIAIEESGGPIDAPALREELGILAPARVAELQDAIESLASTWLDARFEGSALGATKPFTADVGVAREFRRDFCEFVTREGARSKATAETPEAFEVAELLPHQQWLDAYDAKLAGLDAGTCQRLAAWYELFVPKEDRATEGAEAIASLERIRATLRALAREPIEESLTTYLAGLPTEECGAWHARAETVLGASSTLAWLNPLRVLARLKINAFLKERDLERSPESLGTLHRTLARELALRPLRKEFTRRLERFEGHGISPQLVPLRGIDAAAEQLLAMLRPLVELVAVARACPLAAQAELAVRAGQSPEYARFSLRYRGALRRLQARNASIAALVPLARWFPEAWIEAQKDRIHSNVVRAAELRALADAIPTLVAYQAFRRRVPSLPEEALACLRALRGYETALATVDREKLAKTVRQTLAREAHVAWKDRLEAERPLLLLEREMLDSRVQRLEAFDQEFVRLNRELLATDSGLAQPPPRALWEDITRLTGRRARRLREVFEAGVDLGLLKLRPVWLMNPDVASRVLPLRPGLFDLVVFDEASQIPVEHALPSLFRARRAVVSGDEKQMPPTSFFSARLDSDEDELFDPDELDAAVTESERAVLEDTWSRREIKDCEDLLTLARTFLPVSMLQIHYRSNFRELISFSNAAFYGGALHIPVQNPEAQVKRAPPIAVRRVNGTYKGQTNPAEAEAVIEVVNEIWQAPANARPSLGVVTFNRKQADLIEDLIEQRAERDRTFREALGVESQRRQKHEDMGFFVKNVENVQGDERDVIVFSTTFGRDESGAFRRLFGVLGQHGGERRLNVAVTRARDRVILVTSMPVGEISDMMATGRAPAIARDYLQSYMDYATKISDGDLASAHAVASRCQRGSKARTGSATRAHDAFVRSVGEFLCGLGVQPKTAGDDVFGLDFAIEHPTNGLYALGIECDAPRHAVLARARAREIWRRKVLRRSVPSVHRVSSRSWYHDGKSERQRLARAVRAALTLA